MVNGQFREGIEGIIDTMDIKTKKKVYNMLNNFSMPDFSQSLNLITWLAGWYIDGRIGKDEFYQKAYSQLDIMKAHYAKIPFDRLSGRAFEPLFNIRNLFPKVEDTIKELYSAEECQKSEKEQRLGEQIQEICEYGLSHGLLIKTLKEKILEHPKHQNYKGRTKIGGIKRSYT